MFFSEKTFKSKKRLSLHIPVPILKETVPVTFPVPPYEALELNNCSCSCFSIRALLLSAYRMFLHRWIWNCFYPCSPIRGSGTVTIPVPLIRGSRTVTGTVPVLPYKALVLTYCSCPCSSIIIQGSISVPVDAQCTRYGTRLSTVVLNLINFITSITKNTL